MNSLSLLSADVYTISGEMVNIVEPDKTSLSRSRLFCVYNVFQGNSAAINRVITVARIKYKK